MSPIALCPFELSEGMAEYYSAELSQKILRGNNESRKKGNTTGGIMPYGYKIVDKKAVIIPERAEVVRFIYDQYAKNVIVEDIIKSLTDKGVLYNGKPFVRNTVYKILKNEKYSGVYKHGGEVYTNIYPQIVPDELFKMVQDKNANNRYGSLSKYVKYLLHKNVVYANGHTKSKLELKRTNQCKSKSRDSLWNLDFLSTHLER